MQAFGKHLIVKPTEEETLASGLVITMTQSRPMHGTIISVGDKVLALQTGLKVYFTDIVYTTQVDGKDVYVVSEEKIFAYE